LGSNQYDAEGGRGSVNGNTYNSKTTCSRTVARRLVYDGEGNRVAETIGGVIMKYLVDTQNPTGCAQVVDEPSTYETLIR